MVESLSFSNFFEHFYIIHHDKETLHKEDQTTALVYSIFLGLFTLGLVHLGCWAIERCIQLVDKNEKNVADIDRTSRATLSGSISNTTQVSGSSTSVQGPAGANKNLQHVSPFNSASVMPYYYNVREQEAYYLFGKEARGRYADFGGGKEKKDTRPSQTAKREFKEETIGAFPFVEENISLSLKATFKIQVGMHVFYITSLNPIDAEKQLHFKDACLIRKQHETNLKQPNLHHTQLEKIEMAWIKGSELFSTLPSDQPFSEGFNRFRLYEAPEATAPLSENQQIRFCMGEALCHIKAQLDPTGENLKKGFISLHGQEKEIG